MNCRSSVRPSARKSTRFSATPAALRLERSLSTTSIHSCADGRQPTFASARAMRLAPPGERPTDRPTLAIGQRLCPSAMRRRRGTNALTASAADPQSSAVDRTSEFSISRRSAYPSAAADALCCRHRTFNRLLPSTTIATKSSVKVLKHEAAARRRAPGLQPAARQRRDAVKRGRADRQKKADAAGREPSEGATE
jgi:hypothetical protein